ncbi:hypothetical protein NB620_21280 [Vibrio alginolyticus]|nr:hypothetical protein [Vibrio alginolyticus]MCS0002804.1 hypothetical protein [Vibrio alginolyticus]
MSLTVSLLDKLIDSDPLTRDEKDFPASQQKILAHQSASNPFLDLTFAHRSLSQHMSTADVEQLT